MSLIKISIKVLNFTEPHYGIEMKQTNKNYSQKKKSITTIILKRQYNNRRNHMKDKKSTGLLQRYLEASQEGISRYQKYIKIGELENNESNPNQKINTIMEVATCF